MLKTKPTLLILAAGLGWRYGSLKQIDRIGPSGERIIDYSVHDALQAGFGKIVYVIRESFEDEFVEVILNELPSHIDAAYVCQELNSIPSEFNLNPNRVKPWGTGHALLTASIVINEPFAVINADDFYGPDSYKLAHNFLVGSQHNSGNEYALIGYKLKNTLSEYGYVARGVCEVTDDNYVSSVVERTKINITDSGIVFVDDNSEPHKLSGEEIVSMNMFAFSQDIFEHYRYYFNKFIAENGNNLENEFYLPTVINNLIKSNRSKVKVIETEDCWFGLTYHEDKQIAQDKITKLVKLKIYPQKLWNN